MLLKGRGKEEVEETITEAQDQITELVQWNKENFERRVSATSIIKYSWNVKLTYVDIKESYLSFSYMKLEN